MDHGRLKSQLAAGSKGPNAYVPNEEDKLRMIASDDWPSWFFEADRHFVNGEWFLCPRSKKNRAAGIVFESTRCPACERVAALRQEDADANEQQIIDLSPKTRYYIYITNLKAAKKRPQIWDFPRSTMKKFEDVIYSDEDSVTDVWARVGISFGIAFDGKGRFKSAYPKFSVEAKRVDITRHVDEADWESWMDVDNLPPIFTKDMILSTREIAMLVNSYSVAEDDDDEDEDEGYVAPRKSSLKGPAARRKPADDDDDEDDAPKKPAKKAPVKHADDDEPVRPAKKAPVKYADDEDEDEPARPAKKAPVKKAPADEEVEEDEEEQEVDEDEEPAKPAKKAPVKKAPVDEEGDDQIPFDKKPVKGKARIDEVLRKSRS